MEDYEEFYKTICRVCLSMNNTKNMVSLTDTSSEDGLTCYGKAVQIFTNISINDDSLPNRMCDKCLLLLKQAIIFKKTCENSHKRLQNITNKLKSVDTHFKQNVCDYLMFTNSFPEECAKEKFRMKSVKKSVKKTRDIPTISVKNELFFDNDFRNDFDDVFFDYCNEKSELPKKDDKSCNIDDIFDKMELITEMHPGQLKFYQKQYPIRPKQLNPNKKFKKEKRKKQIRPSEQDLQCKICMKVLSNLSSHAAHMQRHGRGNYICEQCGRRFVTNAELHYHLASSHDIGPQFICNECGYKAPKRHELMEHQRIHTGERPYACDKCGLTFRRRYIWKKHSLYHMEKTVQCPQCPKKFHQKGEMISHVNGVHERMYIYACSHCDATYAKTGTVRRHMTEKHGIARSMQGKIRRIVLGKSLNCNLNAYPVGGRPYVRDTHEKDISSEQ